MTECLQFFCCCFDFTQPTPPRQKKKKIVQPPRIQTKYKPEDIIIISDESRKNGKVKSYCCPICTQYYNRILACNECTNCVCNNCFYTYYSKTAEQGLPMRCPFCGSDTSQFKDYELEPHSYFDTTNKGFISKEEREEIDAEMERSKGLFREMPRPLDNILEVHRDEEVENQDNRQNIHQ